MGSWLRRRPQAVVADPVDERTVIGRRTEIPCSAPGCEGADRVRCDYVDRRGTPCPTAWCPDHVVAVAGRGHYCRRHARLAHVLAPIEFRGAIDPPDLDNRAPSLVAFLAEEVGPRVRELLAELVRPDLGESLADDPLHLVMTRARTRRWAQGWKLFDNAGPVLRIGVEVDEESDPEFALRLNGRVILRCVPPWIAERRAGSEANGPARSEAHEPAASGAAVRPATGTEDAERSRQSFVERLVDHQLRPAAIAEDRWVRRWAPAGPGRAGAG